jgi:hypothetical protein
VFFNKHDGEFFMWKHSFRVGNKAVRVIDAAVIQDQCRSWVHQMVLPLKAERTTKGAISDVSRDSGVTFSKVRKIYYGLTDHILAYEHDRLRGAMVRFAENRRAKALEDLNRYDRLLADRHFLERQLDLDV